jgi:hypothetical protein
MWLWPIYAISAKSFDAREGQHAWPFKECDHQPACLLEGFASVASSARQALSVSLK